MKAMILCAGMGTRLKPWTDKHPKALVPVGGIPMLKRVGTNLMDQGFHEITVNVHHFGEQIISFIESDDLLRENTAISDEREMLLDTGGGILNAAPLLGKDERPFLVHNVDILSNADLRGLMEVHEKSRHHVTLLVSERETARMLVFDPEMKLKGWINRKSGETRPAALRMEDADRMLAFSGIYVMSPEVFGIMRRNGFVGKFPIMDFLLSQIPEVHIGGVVQTNLDIIDIGKPDTLHRANLRIQ